ncbi:MAG TPA: IclR family transcriptional regulator C-terminal domain-containing protein [Gammaproteobacteria bacterium]|nr:IclR family transcriptional regulator C-terminal domain-containing protein [Gammaproteobacteria bacterium]
MTDEHDRLFVQAFGRGLSVIKAFGEEAPELTLSEVAKRAGISRASARRLIHTLSVLKYVATDGKRYWLTARILDLGYSYLSSMQTWSFAEEYMEDLVQRVHESCSMSVLDGHDIVYVMRVPTRRILHSTLNVGSRLPAHAQSMGRIQLAALPEAELSRYLATVEPQAFTPYTVTDREELRRIIEADRAKGWSMVSKELEEGICGIAVPIVNRRGKTIAAINLSMHPERAASADTVDRLVRELRNTAIEINSVLKLRH